MSGFWWYLTSKIPRLGDHLQEKPWNIWWSHRGFEFKISCFPLTSLIHCKIERISEKFVNYTIQIAQNHINKSLAIPQLGFAEGDVAICSIAFSSWLLHHLGNLVDFVSSAWEFIPSKFGLCSESGPESGQTQCIHVSYTLYIYMILS